MSDAVVVIALIVLGSLVAWPLLRTWLASDRGGPLVDPEQNITIDPVDGLPGIYQMTYRPMRFPRGRRHPAPPGTVARRREHNGTQEGRSGS